MPATITLYAPTDDCLKTVPEFIENDPEACLERRNQLIKNGIRDLGPHDLVYLVKTKSKSKSEAKQVHSWHWISGLDTSSSASIAAYVTDLSRSLVGSETNWLLGRLSSPWKISQAVVCCWNAFSKVDVRVEISIPGGVRSYALDESLSRIATSAELWTETSVSSVLRAFELAESEIEAGLPRGLHRLEPFPSLADEYRFLDSASSLFWSGWKLGSTLASPQLATAANNRLSMGLLRYFMLSQRPEAGLAFFAPFAAQEKEVKELLVRCLLADDKEPQAVRLLHDVIVAEPTASWIPALLRFQASILMDRMELNIAETLLHRAIQTAPMELDGWVQLARLQLAREEHVEAMITLNAFPYVVEQESAEENSQTASLTLWQPRADLTLIDLSAIEPGSRKDSPLEVLRAQALHGSARAAYQILVRMFQVLGWDGLLAIRASAFVMEEEYVQTRAGTSDTMETDVVENGANNSDSKDSEERSEIPAPSSGDGIRAPSCSAATKKDVGTKKRICERWLDSIFMILYEDLRLHSIYKAELDSALSSGKKYDRTPREWLLIGRLSLRLGFSDDARYAFERCCHTGFSRTAWLGLLDLWCKNPTDTTLSHALEACRKLVADSMNRFEKPLHVGTIGYALRTLVRRHGLKRVCSTLESLQDRNRPVTKAPEDHLPILLDRIADQGCIGANF